MGMDLSTADGNTLTVEREEGEPQVGDKASPDGTFVMPDGKTIVVEGGVITDIQTDSNVEGGDEGGEGSDEEMQIADLQQKVSDLEAEVEELKKQLEDANAKAKTKEDLLILNAVKIAGGKKALAKLSSDYKPEGRQKDGANARQKAEGQAEVSAMRAEIEARRNGTFKKEQK